MKVRTAKLRGPPMRYSATILAFGEPLLRLIEAGAPITAARNAMLLVVTTWNSLVIDAALGTTENEKQLRDSLALMPEPGATLYGPSVEQLITRKKSLFAAHDWIVGKWEVLGRTDGELRLRVEAHQAPRAG